MPNTRDALMQEYQIPISLSAEVEDLLDEIIRLRRIVRAYGQFQTTWAEQQYITGMFVQVPTKVAWATENVRELFAEEIERTLNELQTYMDQRRHLMPKEDA
jgi:hypothetical protein